ncbi:MAG: diguanylate cyclase [Sphaerochaetaceae bacterium]|nr:diguanylate cyclase [Spirochaetales bacterium]MDY5500432.1 diguanylate cyclase [Sphaerochaetaceae bacterium]
MQTTLTLLVLSSVVSIVLLIGSSTFLFLVSYQKKSNAIILNERCQREASVLELHFSSSRQSVDAVATFAKNNAFGHLSDLAESPDYLLQYQDSLDKLLDVAANNTQDVLISYYALNSDFLPGVPGTWLTRNSADLPFRKKPVPDYRLFDGINQSGWWYVPQRARKAVSFGPYFSSHANRLVLTYAVPIYEQGICLCVVGMSFDYRTMATYLDAINEMKGHAILLDDDDNVMYAPDMEVGTPLFAQIPGLIPIKDFPDGSGNELVSFKQDGKRMSAAYRRLSNGMGLLLVVPDSSLYGESYLLGTRILLMMVLTLVVAGFASSSKLKKLFSPLNELNEAMTHMSGEMTDLALPESGNDEIGQLTDAIKYMAGKLKTYLHFVNQMAYTDSLTGAENKLAFSNTVKHLDEQARKDSSVSYTVVFFDVNNLKFINDTFGHMQGDRYLLGVYRLLRSIFPKSPIYRIGGDEFILLPQGEELADIEGKLANLEVEVSERSDAPLWTDRLSVAWGKADFIQDIDPSFDSVFRRAEQAMYAQKRRMEALR